MDVTNIIKAVRARCKSFNSRVYGAYEFVSLTRTVNPASMPAAFVFTASETAETLQDSATDYYQLVTARIAVVVMADAGDERGQKGTDVTAGLQKELFSALLGWSPIKGDPHAILSYDGCEPLSRNPAVVCFQFNFLCTYQLSVEDSFITSGLQDGDDITGLLPAAPFKTVDIGADNKAYGVDFIENSKPDGKIDYRTKITIPNSED